MEDFMDFEMEIMNLKKVIQEQQNRVSTLEGILTDINKELVVIGEEMHFPGKDGYPSIYDIKEKLVEKGWLKKPIK
jgi:hypothetical protein